MAASQDVGREPVLLILGDSLSASYGIDQERGWVSLLEARLRDQGLPQRIINASISGETTAGGVTRLAALLEQHRPTILLIELGANDGLRGMAFERIRDNLTEMIALGHAAGSQVVLASVRLPPNYGAAYTEGFQAVFRDIATEQSIPLIEDFLAGVAQDRALMQADTIHPTAAAQPLILENVWPTLEPLLRADRGT